MSWIAVAGVAVSAIGTGVSLSQQRKAQRQQQRNLSQLPTGADMMGMVQPYEPVDIMGAVMEAAGWNAGPGTDMALGMATKINRRATKDVEEAMAKLFGGGDALNTQRGLTNDAVETWLRGDVSASTKQMLGRQALATGADLGSGAVADLYTGYLGLTKEQLIGQGMDAYRSLYGMYRQAVPLISAIQTLPYTAIEPGQMAQLTMYNELNRANSQMEAAQMAYSADLNRMTGGNAIAANQASSTNAAIAAAAQVAGSYLGSRNTGAASRPAQVTPYGGVYTGTYGGTPAYRPQVV